MNAFGIQYLDAELLSVENRSDENPSNNNNKNLTRTRNNSLTELPQNYEQFINKNYNVKFKHASKYLSKKENANVNEQTHIQHPLYIARVTLTLGVTNQKLTNNTNSSAWKYNSIRRNPTPNYLNCTRQSSNQNRKYFKQSFLYHDETNRLDSENLNEMDKSPSHQSNNEQENEDHSSTSSHRPQPKFRSPNSSVASTYTSRPQLTSARNLFLETSRSKSSYRDTSVSGMDTQRSIGSYSCGVGEFNKFKNNILKNRPRDHSNLDNVLSINQFKGANVSFNKFSQPYINQSNQGGSKPVSKIKSIYETIQRETRQNSEIKRSVGYLNAKHKAETLLSSSLVIKKL